MKRRNFIKTAGIAAAGAIAIPYVLPTGRLFAATGSRIADHVVFILFAGGIRNQESVKQQYLINQNAALPTGNIMPNMLTGAGPSSSYVYTPWTPALTSSLAAQGTLFKELRYTTGPTGHYNGHTVAMTGRYTNTGLNLNVNPEFPTVFEYYRKHTDPSSSALNAWWLSEGLGPYPSLNYSRYDGYGPLYAANYLRPATVFGTLAGTYLNDAKAFAPDDVTRMFKVKSYLDDNFDKSVESVQGVVNTEDDQERVKQFITGILDGSNPFEYPLPSGVPTSQLTGDLINIGAGWKVLEEFAPELTVINTFNLDICHSNFTGYIQSTHKADYGVGWLWDKIQSHPEMKDNTIMICMPEHGRNLDPNSLVDANGLAAFDHTNDDNSRELFALIAGPSSMVHHGKEVGTSSSPVGECIDIVPTIANILGFDDKIPTGMLPGRNLNEAFV